MDSHANSQSIQPSSQLPPFTPREVDIIACLTYGKSTSGIATLLSLSSRTIDNHIRNIMLKIECNSRESILNFVERAGYVPLLRQHYGKLNPLVQEEVEEPASKPQKIHTTKKKSLLYISLIGLTIVIGGGLFRALHPWSKELKEYIARSDFSLPAKSALLDRPQILKEIEAAFTNKEEIQTVALIGMGGAGKTTLARQYAYSQYFPIVWEFNAESRESLKASFENLADVLAKTEADKNLLRELQEINNPIEKEEKLIRFVKERLRKNPTWFLVYDNVEKLKDMQLYFPNDPATWGKGAILITTRDSNLQNDSHIHHSILIGELDANQKLDLFLKIINHDNTQHLTTAQKKDAQQFLEKISSFPLDVSVAAYYIKSTSVPYEKYITYINQSSKDFESLQANFLRETSSYTKTRYGIITLSLQKLMETHKDFGDLLLFISLIDSQNIPRDLLVKYKNDPVVDSFIYHLKKYSLLTNELSLPSPFESTLSLHRSTQAIILAHFLKTLSFIETKTRVRSISNVLEQIAEQGLEKEKTAHIKTLLNHFNVFLSHDHLLSPLIKSSLTFELGRMYGHLNQYEKAKELLEQSLDILQKHGKEKDIKLAQVLAYLGSIYKELGNPQKSQELLEQSLLIYNKNPKENQGEIARALAYLGDTYRNKADLIKAKTTLEESVLLYKQQIPVQHPGLALALTNFGSTQRELRNVKEAINALEESLSLYRKYIPENFMGIARALYYLGPAYTNKGDFQKARSVLEESIGLFRKHSSKNNILIGRALVHLGNVYRELGEYKKAKDIFEQAFSIHKIHHTKEHSQYAWSLIHLGFVERELANPQKAKFILEQCLETYKKHFDEKNIYIARILAQLARIHNDLGHYETTLTLLKASIPAHEETYGKDHVETARVINILAQTYLLTGDLTVAEAYLKKILRIFQENKHPDVYKVYEDLSDLELKKAQNAESQERSQEAEDHKAQAINYLMQAQEIVKATFSENSPHFIRIGINLRSLEEP